MSFLKCGLFAIIDKNYSRVVFTHLKSNPILKVVCLVLQKIRDMTYFCDKMFVTTCLCVLEVRCTADGPQSPMVVWVVGSGTDLLILGVDPRFTWFAKYHRLYIARRGTRLPWNDRVGETHRTRPDGVLSWHMDVVCVVTCPLDVSSVEIQDMINSYYQ